MIDRDIFFVDSFQKFGMKSKKVLDFLYENNGFAFTIEEIVDKVGLRKNESFSVMAVLKKHDFIYFSKVHGKQYYLFKEKKGCF